MSGEQGCIGAGRWGSPACRGGGSGVGRKEEGAQLAEAPGPSLSSLLALAAALTLLLLNLLPLHLPQYLK